MSPTNDMGRGFYFPLGKTCVGQYHTQTSTVSEYLCSSGAAGENQALKKAKLNSKQTLYFLRRLQKSGPTRRQNCSTVYFTIVIGNSSKYN